MGGLLMQAAAQATTADTVALYALIGTIVASGITAVGTVVVALIQARTRDRDTERLEDENRELREMIAELNEED